MSQSYCPYCGTPVQDDDHFCPYCGTELPREETSPAPHPTDAQPDHPDETRYVGQEEDPTPWDYPPSVPEPPRTPMQPVTPVTPDAHTEREHLARYALMALLAFLAIGAGIFAFARMGDDAATCTVLFETAGGTPVPAQEVTEGSQITSPASPVKEGCTFDAWYLDAQHNAQATFPYTVTEDVTFYASYTSTDTEADPGTKHTATTTHTVSFETSGGSSVAAQTVDDGAQLVSPPDPVRDGYAFVGWYREGSYVTQAIFPLTVTSDMTLYAKWESEVPEVTTFVINNDDCLNVRSAPGVYGTQVYYQVHPGVTLYWYGEQQQATGSDGKERPWYYVNVSGTEVWGWVSSLYLTPGTGSDGPQPASGERLTLNDKASGMINVRAEPTYFSDSLWELHDGDMVYWGGESAKGLAKDKRNHTWYYVNVSGTEVWGWVFAEYTTAM